MDEENPGEDSLLRQLAKRLNGKLVRLDGDGWEALALYKAHADDLHAESLRAELAKQMARSGSATG